METTEKIVEAYVRYIKGWVTIANIKCKGQYEIDLLASVDWSEVARRIGWLTWEDCEQLLPGSCPWLTLEQQGA